MMRIGIDFDNTIVCYDGVFHKAALARGWLPPEVADSKDAIRDHFRISGQEALWTELQGYVYGSQMDLAKPFEGVDLFFQSTKSQVFIISHKTLHPYLGPRYDLHKAARDWLQEKPFLSGVTAYFELTLEEKLNRIEILQCDAFIDDLPELLLEPSFPKNVQKILFDPQKRHQTDPRYLKFSSWNQINHHFRFNNG